MVYADRGVKKVVEVAILQAGSERLAGAGMWWWCRGGGEWAGSFQEIYGEILQSCEEMWF